MRLLSRILKYSKKATSTTHRKQIRRALFFGRKDYFLATFAPKNLDTTRNEDQVFDFYKLIYFRLEITQIFTDIIDNPRTYKSILFHKLQKLAREGPDRHPTAFTPWVISNQSTIEEEDGDDNITSDSVIFLHDLWILSRCDRAPSKLIIMISRLTIPDIKINISLIISMIIWEGKTSCIKLNTDWGNIRHERRQHFIRYLIKIKTR